MNIEAKQLREKVHQILDDYQHEKEMLVSILQDTQGVYNYLPKEVIEQVSRGLDVPLSQVYSVATFFKSFSLKPRGRHIINVCLGTACHVLLVALRPPALVPICVHPIRSHNKTQQNGIPDHDYTTRGKCSGDHF